MKVDKVLFGLKAMIVLSALSLACLLLQISADVVLYETYGINPNADTNRFFGFALVLCFTLLIVSVYTHFQYKKTKQLS
jgi:dolichyl-phosphate-mannose--protein O-mannosyl transferase